MRSEKVETAFNLMQQSIELIQNSLDVSFWDAYIENGENIIDNYQVRVVDGLPNQENVEMLETFYKELESLVLSPEEIRRLTQLVLLNGSKTEQLQANHQLTPDSIGFLFVYIIEQLYSKDQKLTILDPASGIGNLLLTIILNGQLADYNMQAFGVDIDDTLLAVAATNNEWTKAPIRLFHQDGLQDLLIDPVDVAVSDLPIGYYPNDEKAGKFASKADEGHSYSHHLLMEQAMKFVRPDGFGLFLVPNNFLETEQSQFFKNWLKKNVYLQGMIQLPDDLFRSEHSRKSILILQNKGELSEQVKEVLIIKLGSLKNTANITQFFQQFEAWKSSNLK